MAPDIAKGINDYLTLANSLEADKQLCDDTQASVESVLQSTRVSEWNGTITHVFTVTFTDAAARLSPLMLVDNKILC